MSEETAQTVDTSSETTSEATTVTADGSEQSVTSYLNGKYESVSALEAGYNELQSSYSKKNAEYKEQLGAFSGAPEGEYELSEGIDVYDSVQAYAKENQFSNEALNGLAEVYSQAENEANQAYIAQQKEILGKDADTRTKNVVDWARANLGEGSIEALNSMVTSAAGVEMFEQIAKMASGTASAQVATPKTTVDKDTLTAMRFEKDQYGNRKMSSDPQYRSKVNAMMEEFVSNGGKLQFTFIKKYDTIMPILNN